MLLYYVYYGNLWCSAWLGRRDSTYLWQARNFAIANQLASEGFLAKCRQGISHPEFINLASGLGLEPRLLGPEPSVLPLDDPEIKPTNRLGLY